MYRAGVLLCVECLIASLVWVSFYHFMHLLKFDIEVVVRYVTCIVWYLNFPPSYLFTLCFSSLKSCIKKLFQYVERVYPMWWIQKGWKSLRICCRAPEWREIGEQTQSKVWMESHRGLIWMSDRHNSVQQQLVCIENSAPLF